MSLISMSCLFRTGFFYTYPFEDELQYVMINVSTAFITLQDCGKVFKSSFRGKIKTIILQSC